uniref:Uncharacterized protein n=1 Tax=Salarias fasciatus TaxID=181472 RepID=A0A672F414_SALFA
MDLLSLNIGVRSITTCFSVSSLFLQDDMHRVIDQQLMDKHQDEWRSATTSLSGSRAGGGGAQSSRRAQRISERDRRLFSFFKKN